MFFYQKFPAPLLRTFHTVTEEQNGSAARVLGFQGLIGAGPLVDVLERRCWPPGCWRFFMKLIWQLFSSCSELHLRTGSGFNQGSAWRPDSHRSVRFQLHAHRIWNSRLKSVQRNFWFWCDSKHQQNLETSNLWKNLDMLDCRRLKIRDDVKAAAILVTMVTTHQCVTPWHPSQWEADWKVSLRQAAAAWKLQFRTIRRFWCHTWVL